MVSPHPADAIRMKKYGIDMKTLKIPDESVKKVAEEAAQVLSLAQQADEEHSTQPDVDGETASQRKRRRKRHHHHQDAE